MTYRVTLIPGDGIGPEVTAAARAVIDASGTPIQWEVQHAGESVIKEHGTPLPEHVIQSIARNKIALKGPIATPVGKGFRSVNVALRQRLNLFANIRPIRSFEGLPSLHRDVDLVIVRENTEDLYAGIEHMVGEDAAESIKIITKKASDNICRFAFELALKEGRKKVSATHKANIMKLSDGLFLRCAREVSEGYKEMDFEDVIIDAMSMKLVQNPQNYDVVVTTNLYGDILSDMSAGLVGGLGLVPGANIGEDAAVFEPVHGTAPDISGKNKANPTSAILSGVMMLKHLGEMESARKIEDALADIFKEGKYLTEDLGGNTGTDEFAMEVINRMSK